MGAYETIIDKVVSGVKKEIAGANVQEMDALCRYASHNISYDLSSLGVESVIEDISELTMIPYSHSFVVVKALEGPALYYLIDITYSQFIPAKNKQLRIFDAWPGEELKKSRNGEELLNELLEKGYSQVDDGLLGLYLKSFDPQVEIVFTLDDLFYGAEEKKLGK